MFEYVERFHNPRMRRRIARHDRKLQTLSQPSLNSEENSSDTCWAQNNSHGQKD